MCLSVTPPSYTQCLVSVCVCVFGGGGGALLWEHSANPAQIPNWPIRHWHNTNTLRVPSAAEGSKVSHLFELYSVVGWGGVGEWARGETGTHSGGVGSILRRKKESWDRSANLLP